VKTLNIYINNTKVEVEVDDDITEDEAEKIAEEISKDDFFNECNEVIMCLRKENIEPRN
jgi:hypothetical protein